MAVEYILKNSLLRRTLDNVTVVMIAFKNFKREVFGEDKTNNRGAEVQSGRRREEDKTQKNESEGENTENIPPSHQTMKEAQTLKAKNSEEDCTIHSARDQSYLSHYQSKP